MGIRQFGDRALSGRMAASNMDMTLIVFLATAHLAYVQGHGMLIDPPARNTMWRHGFPNPANMDDNGLNCGGFNIMWKQNGGKCGVCGDAYQGPRRHEVGYPGGFANGIIGRAYKKGQVIPVDVKITANHKGFVQFRLCPNNDPKGSITQDCLDRYLLSDSNGQTKFELLSSLGSQSLRYSLKLPPDVTCSYCVLQWWWTAGNNNGPPDTKQEAFVNCADIAINDASQPATSFAPQHTSSQTTTPPQMFSPPQTRSVMRTQALPVSPVNQHSPEQLIVHENGQLWQHLPESLTQDTWSDYDDYMELDV